MKRSGAYNRRRRGTAYVLALALTSILIVLGIAATQIARGEMQKNTLEHDVVQARIAAHYTLDYIHKLLDDDADWRDGAQNKRWVFLRRIGDAYLYFAYYDQIDGDITNDYTQPFLLYVAAVVGDTRRVYRVELVPDEDGDLTRNTSTLQQVPNGVI